MGGEWQTVRLKDVANEITVGHVGSMASEYVEAGVPFLRSLNIEPFRINENDLRFITLEFHMKLRKSALRPGDVVIVRTGKPGATALVPPWLKEANCSDLVIVRPGKELNNRFFVYFMNSVAKRHVAAHIVGAVQQHFNVGSSRDLIINLPPIHEQQAIACILGAFDDKIELNRRMNRTMEDMARAIFKSWFVDFDPVRAKAAGQQPPLPAPQSGAARQAGGLKPEIADLFPDSFEDSELGEIPKGWSVQSFADRIDIIGGGTPKTSVPEYWGGETPWYSVVDSPPPGEVFVISTEKTITQAGVDNSSTRILPKGATIISARGTVGNIALVGTPMAMNQSCYGLKDRRGKDGYFLFFATAEVVDTLRQRAHGSVFNTITRDTLKGVRVVAPPDIFVTTFEYVVGAMMQRILSAVHESRSLATLRDTLLPKLISGELRVPDAERIAGRCL